MSGVLAFLAITVGTIWGQVQSDGRIAGRLTNGTPDGASVGGTTVTLAALHESGWQTERTATTDAIGGFSFSGLARDGSTLYLPIAAHDGAWYYPGQPISLSDAPSAEVTITVYDATQTDEALRYERSAMLIAGIQPAALTVMEMSGLSNTEPRTVVGSEMSSAGQLISAHFPLPTGAIGFQPQRGIIDSQLVPTQDGMGLIWPVFPGRQELAYSYQLPYSGDRVAIEKVLAYPVSTFSVYLPEGGLELSSTVLRPQGSAELGGRRYQLFTANDLNRGDRISAQITGISAAINGPQQPMTAPLMVASGAMLMLAGVGAAFAWRRRVGSQSTAAVGSEAVGPVAAQNERQQLILEIAALDERHDQRLLPEDAYKATRAALMRRVIALSTNQPRDASRSEHPVPTG